jgi:LmbE family N-acetylglucosaminyl deacetylase
MKYTIFCMLVISIIFLIIISLLHSSEYFSNPDELGIFVHTYKPFNFRLFDTRPRILILCAHPDDESIFASRDMLNNNCTVICLTTPIIKKRREEFFKVLQLTGQTGHLLNFPDSIDFKDKDDINELWFNLTDKEIFELYIFNIIKNQRYDMIVSHDRYGEYGHPQHKRLNELSLYIASVLNTPFNDFKSRYVDETPEERKRADNIRDIYKSQSVVVRGSKKDMFIHKRCKN